MSARKILLEFLCVLLYLIDVVYRFWGGIRTGHTMLAEGTISTPINQPVAVYGVLKSTLGAARWSITHDKAVSGSHTVNGHAQFTEM